jgi:biotin operon repressor
VQYQRSLEIEQRLEKVLRLIQLGSYSTPSLASEIGVSIPTISRCIQALRERGNEIRTEKDGSGGWRYVLSADNHATTPHQQITHNQLAGTPL